MKTGARDAIIEEASFSALLSRPAEEFLRFINLLLHRDTRDWLKRHYSELATRSHEMETLLDDYGARNNRSFSYLTELVASLRGFGKMAVALKHLISRIDRYQIRLDNRLSKSFFAENERSIRFLNHSILALAKEIRKECEHLSVRVPNDSRADATVSEEEVHQLLPHNIDEGDVLDEELKIAELASEYLKVADQFAWGVRSKIEDPDDLRRFVKEQLDEETCRQYQAMIHSLQSKYDTYVKDTLLESRMEALANLRGHVSVTLHLLESTTELVHFYVRHENDVRSEQVKVRIAELIDKRAVLDRTVNFGLYFASRIFQAGRAFADEALVSVVSVQEIRVRIPENESLHARPISLIVKIVNHFGTRVELEIDGESCDASSIMEIIMVAGNHPEAREIAFRGDQRPLADLEILFENGLGEAGLHTLPAELGYLK